MDQRAFDLGYRPYDYKELCVRTTGLLNNMDLFLEDDRIRERCDNQSSDAVTFGVWFTTWLEGCISICNEVENYAALMKRLALAEERGAFAPMKMLRQWFKVGEINVAKFEADYGIVLPSDYRLFIRRIFRDGTCPIPYLNRLDQLFSRVLRNGEDYSEWLKGSLSKPFLLTGRTGAGSNRMEGCFPIAGDTEKVSAYLVVTGQKRGHIWKCEKNDCNYVFEPILRNEEPVNMIAWYEGWLDELGIP